MQRKLRIAHKCCITRQIEIAERFLVTRCMYLLVTRASLLIRRKIFRINVRCEGFSKLHVFWVNTVLCYVNTVLCYVNTVLCYVNTVLCYVNTVLCYVNTVLCYVITVLCYVNTVLCYYILYCVT
jgi:hypothetical protein